VIRVVALFLLLACAAQGSVDSIWCPDGCQGSPTQRATTSHQSSSVPGVCLFCGTGFIVTAPVLPAAPRVDEPLALFTSTVSIPSAAFHAIDHPPRLS
jgi:hypothetical protein